MHLRGVGRLGRGGGTTNYLPGAEFPRREARQVLLPLDGCAGVTNESRGKIGLLTSRSEDGCEVLAGG